jgi:hypothetical protein
MTVRVLTHRTHNRYWLEIKYSNNGGGGSLRLYLTTTSQKKADSWIAAICASELEGTKETRNA